MRDNDVPAPAGPMRPGTLDREEPAEGRSTIRRALTILSAFSERRERLSLADLDRLTGLPKPSLHRLCGQLVEEGALVRGADGRYQIGTRMWLIGSGVPMIRVLREVAPRYMATLGTAVPGEVLLMIRQGYEVLGVSRVGGQGPGAGRIARRTSLTESAAGLVMLAYADPDTADAVLREASGRIGSCALRSALEGVRRRGYARKELRASADHAELSVPIWDGSRHVVAAMSVVVRAGSPTVPALLALRRAGEGIGGCLPCGDDEKVTLSFR
ncbi:transcriptional regulator, IclR family [Streptomyces albus]|uniref:Transcriptional regulator, IclR family n=1 Tax=Streptomyces albus (strain ATCC 21838 / DSM 41398 / FERM P-419 / JCM 4703 / NBRC 107858) TaxID=1081613 RepID=A0A0B5EGF1_STRA4|nr:transcriptional regulator, IclR family [Streptomyces albus]AOU74714.1 transcriptional regulator, IclR family [Streptomyces albus]AYN30525.1 hypothetical protein DUI70_0022 [Streptomyces albus]